MIRVRLLRSWMACKVSYLCCSFYHHIYVVIPSHCITTTTPSFERPIQYVFESDKLLSTCTNDYWNDMCFNFFSCSVWSRTIRFCSRSIYRIVSLFCFLESHSEISLAVFFAKLSVLGVVALDYMGRCEYCCTPEETSSVELNVRPGFIIIIFKKKKYFFNMDRFDEYFFTIAKETGGIEGLLNTFFNFL